MMSLNHMKLLSLFCATTLTSHHVYANTVAGSAAVTFAIPITVNSSVNMDFGTFSTESLSANATRILTTAGTYGPGNITTVSSSGTAAEFSVVTSQTSSVSVNVVSGNSKVTMINFVCKDGASDVNCDPGDGYTIASNKTIRVGATARIVDPTSLAGTTQQPTYVMTVNYQ